jgi:hypothetical protein
MHTFGVLVVLAALLSASVPRAYASVAFSANVSIDVMFSLTEPSPDGGPPPVRYSSKFASVACLNPRNPLVVYSISYTYQGIFSRILDAPSGVPEGVSPARGRHLVDDISGPTNIACIDDMMYVASSITTAIYSIRIEANNNLTVLGFIDSLTTDSRQMIAFKESDGSYGIHLTTSNHDGVATFMSSPTSDGVLVSRTVALSNPFSGEIASINPYDPGHAFCMCADPTGALLVLARERNGPNGTETIVYFYHRPFRGANAGQSYYTPAIISSAVIVTGGEIPAVATCAVMPRMKPSDSYNVVFSSTQQSLPVTWSYAVTLPGEMDGQGGVELVSEPVVIGNTTEMSFCSRLVPNPTGTTVWCSRFEHAVTSLYDTTGFEVADPYNVFTQLTDTYLTVTVLFEPGGKWHIGIAFGADIFSDAHMWCMATTDSVYAVGALEIGGIFVENSVQNPAFVMRSDEVWPFSADSVRLSNPAVIFERSTTFGDYEDGMNNGSSWELRYPPDAGHNNTLTAYELTGTNRVVDLSNLTNSGANVTLNAVPVDYINTLPPGHYSFDYVGQFRPARVLHPDNPVRLASGPVNIVIEDAVAVTGLDPLKPVGPFKDLTGFSEFNGYSDRIYALENMVVFHESATSSPRLSWMSRSNQNTGSTYILGDFRSYTYCYSVGAFVRVNEPAGSLSTVRFNQTTGVPTEASTDFGVELGEFFTTLDVYTIPDFGGPGADEAYRVGLYRWNTAQDVYVSTVTINATDLSLIVGGHVYMASGAPDAETMDTVPNGVSVNVDVSVRASRQWAATAGGYRPYANLERVYPDIPRRVTCFLTYTSRVACGYAYTRTVVAHNGSVLRNVNDAEITSLSQWVLTEVGLSHPLESSNSTDRTAPVSIVGHPSKDIFVVIYEGEIRVMAVAAPRQTPNALGAYEPIGRLVHIGTSRMGARCTVGEYIGTNQEYFAVACGAELFVYISSQSTGLLTFDKSYNFSDEALGALNASTATIQDISVAPGTNTIDVLVDEGRAGLAHLHTFEVDPDPLVELVSPQSGDTVWASANGAGIHFYAHITVNETRLIFVRTEGETEGDEIVVDQSNLLNAATIGPYGIGYNLRMWNNATTLPYTPGLQGFGRVAVEVYTGEEWVRSPFVSHVTFMSFCEYVPAMDPFTQCNNCTWRFQERGNGTTYCNNCVAGLYSAPNAAPAQFCYLNSTQCRTVRCSDHGSCIDGRVLDETEGATCSCDNYVGNGTWGTTYMGHLCHLEPWQCRDEFCNGLGNCTSARTYGTNCSCTAAATGPQCQACTGNFSYAPNNEVRTPTSPAGSCSLCETGNYGPGCNQDEPVCTTAEPGQAACASCTEMTDSETGTTPSAATAGCECYRDIFNQSLDTTCDTHFCGDGVPSETELGVCNCSEGRVQSAEPSHNQRLCIRDCLHGTYSYTTDECVCDHGFDGILCEVADSVASNGPDTPATLSDPKEAPAIAVGVVVVSAAAFVFISIAFAAVVAL